MFFLGGGGGVKEILGVGEVGVGGGKEMACEVTYWPIYTIRLDDSYPCVCTCNACKDVTFQISP
jgi:hypothetical protein